MPHPTAGLEEEARSCCPGSPRTGPSPIIIPTDSAPEHQGERPRRESLSRRDRGCGSTRRPGFQTGHGHQREERSHPRLCRRPLAEHREASRFAAGLYTIPCPDFRMSRSPLPSPSKSVSIDQGPAHGALLHALRRNDRLGRSADGNRPHLPLIREMGSPETATDFHRRLIEGGSPGVERVRHSYIMQVVYFKELAEKIQRDSCHAGTDAGVGANDEILALSRPPGGNQLAFQKDDRADVAIFPSGGNIIPSSGDFALVSPEKDPPRADASRQREYLLGRC